MCKERSIKRAAPGLVGELWSFEIDEGTELIILQEEITSSSGYSWSKDILVTSISLPETFKLAKKPNKCFLIKFSDLS